MTPDEAKQIRKGDVLTIRAVACETGIDAHELVTVRIGPWTAYVNCSDILSRTPAPREIKVGDRVTWKHRGGFYKVASLFECRAVIDPVESGTLAGIVAFQGDLRHADATEGHA